MWGRDKGNWLKVFVGDRFSSLGFEGYSGEESVASGSSDEAEGGGEALCWTQKGVVCKSAPRMGDPDPPPLSTQVPESSHAEGWGSLEETQGAERKGLPALPPGITSPAGAAPLAAP